MPEVERIVFFSEGGMGDHLLHTPAVRGLKKKYGAKVTIVAFYEDMWKNNPNINDLWPMQKPAGVYEKRVKNADLVFRPNLYLSSPNTRLKKHVKEYICDLVGVEYDNQPLDFVLTEQEEITAKAYVESFDKPVILIQTQAGTPPVLEEGKFKQVTSNKDWFKDRWEKVVSELSSEYFFIQVGLPNEEPIKEALSLLGQTSVRDAAALIKYVKTFIVADSYLAHISNAFQKKGIVLFGRSRVGAWGHNHNINLYKQSNCPDQPCGRPKGQWSDHEFKNGKLIPWKCPDRKCMKMITASDVVGAVQEIVHGSVNEQDTSNNSP